MKKLILLMVLFAFNNSTFASDMEVVEVRRNITLSDDDPIYKDFYIQADSGLKKNLVVKATRKLTVRDSGQKNVGEFKTTVGLLKIIHVEGKVAVAREFRLIPRDEAPMLEQTGIMIGDSIDLSDSFTDTSKPPQKRKTASAPATTEPTQTVAPQAPAGTEPATLIPGSPIPLKSDTPTHEI